MDQNTLLLLAFVLLLAGIVKGTIGFGLPLVALSILTQFLPKEWALALMVFPVVFSNLFLGIRSRLFKPMLVRFWPVIACVGTGLMIGAFVLQHFPQQYFLLLVGVVIIVFSLAEQFRLVLSVPAEHERSVGMAAGLFGGLLGGVSTAYGPPLIMYLTALRLSKTEFIAAIGVIWTFASVALVLAFNLSGVLVGERALWSLAACVPVGIGLWLGTRLRDRIPQEPFRRLVGIALLLLGANLIRRGLMQ